jgi:hypothetical protein
MILIISYANVGLDKYPENKNDKYDNLDQKAKVIKSFRLKQRDLEFYKI